MFDWFWQLLADAFTWLLDLLPTDLADSFTTLGDQLSGFTGHGHYLAYLMGLDLILPLTLSVFMTRFIIRRIPFLN